MFLKYSQNTRLLKKIGFHSLPKAQHADSRSAFKIIYIRDRALLGMFLRLTALFNLVFAFTFVIYIGSESATFTNKKIKIFFAQIWFQDI